MDNIPIFFLYFCHIKNALFNNADKYIKIVEALAGKSSGMMRSEIEAKTGISGGQLTKMVTNLERCDFIKGFNRIGNKSKLTLYRLLDFYTLFYFKFIQGNRTMDEDYWMQTSKRTVWKRGRVSPLSLSDYATLRKSRKRWEFQAFLPQSLHGEVFPIIAPTNTARRSTLSFPEWTKLYIYAK